MNTDVINKINADLLAKHHELTYGILNAAFNVHNTLGLNQNWNIND